MPTTTLIPKTPALTIDGSPVSQQVLDDLIELRVEHAVSTPSRLTLRFSDHEFKLIDGTIFTVGKAIVVKFPGQTTETTTAVFDGEIVSVGVEQPPGWDGEGFELLVIALDKSHRLTHQGGVQTYLKQKYSDIVSSIAGSAGLQAQVTDTGVVHEYHVITGTHYDAVDWIGRAVGHEWKVEGSKLIMRPRPTSPPNVALTYGVDIRRLKVRYTASERTDSVEVRSWDPLTKKVITKLASVSTTTPADELGSTAPLGSKGRTDSTGASTKRVVATLPVASAQEAQKVADGIATRVAASDLYVRGECLGNPAIEVGSTVEVKNAGTRISGKYYVTSVEHIFGRASDFVTRFSSGGAEPRTLVDLLGGRSTMPGAFDGSGLCVGIVTNHKDPDGLGRVKLKFPVMSEAVESTWARVLAIGGGTDTGLFVMPKVNDEVLVGFEQGDIRRPYVLGGLYGGTAKPPIVAHADSGEAAVVGGVVEQWLMKTGGHAMTMRSGTQPEQVHTKIVVKDGKATLHLGHDKVELISTDKSVTVKNGKASIVLSDSGDITIKGVNVTIEATSGDVNVKGTNINSKANVGAKLEGINVEVKATAALNLQSSAMTQVKGMPLKLN